MPQKLIMTKDDRCCCGNGQDGRNGRRQACRGSETAFGDGHPAATDFRG